MDETLIEKVRQYLAVLTTVGIHASKAAQSGSHARGGANPDSDVDILVIGPFEGRSAARLVEIRMKLRPGFSLDLPVRTREKVGERIEMGDLFLDEILKRGGVLYEADHR
jgi:predicted nucleotidyltransferase